MDYRKLYNLEAYLFNDVRKRWEGTARITPFDFYCILVWKANRAKTKTKNRLVTRAGSFSEAVSQICADLKNATDSKTRLAILMSEWGFRLPMASAILTVLFPRVFTVYDVRVCKVLRQFEGLESRRFSETLWGEYLSFKRAVDRAAPAWLSLRDKDRYLWGRSLYDDIRDQSA